MDGCYLKMGILFHGGHYAMSEDCAHKVLNSTLDFFHRPQDARYLDKATEFIRRCNTVGLACSVFHPAPWLGGFRWGSLSTLFIKRDELRSKLQYGSGVLVHHASAMQLYGLTELWTHFVCEYIQKGRSVGSFDPYEHNLINDYGNSKKVINYCSLFDMAHVMIFVQEISE